MVPAITPAQDTATIPTYYVGEDQVILLGESALVSSKSEPGQWREVDAKLGLCACKSFEYRGRCRHIDAVKQAQEQDRASAQPVEAPKPMCSHCQKRPAYRENLCTRCLIPAWREN